MIWRAAVEVNWDNKGLFLYSLKPREWSYLDWYKHITGTIESEYKCILFLSENTEWVNIPPILKNQIKG